MLIRYTDFEASLTKRKFHANYFLFGADSFLIELAVKGLTRALEEGSEGQIAPITLDLDETSVEEFVNTAQSLSMFAPRQLLVVKGAMKLREHQGKRLAPYFSNPNPQTVALFLAGDLRSAEEKDFRHPFIGHTCRGVGSARTDRSHGLDAASSQGPGLHGGT